MEAVERLLAEGFLPEADVHGHSLGVVLRLVPFLLGHDHVLQRVALLKAGPNMLELVAGRIGRGADSAGYVSDCATVAWAALGLFLLNSEVEVRLLERAELGSLTPLVLGRDDFLDLRNCVLRFRLSCQFVGACQRCFLLQGEQVEVEALVLPGCEVPRLFFLAFDCPLGARLLVLDGVEALIVLRLTERHA